MTSALLRLSIVISGVLGIFSSASAKDEFRLQFKVIGVSKMEMAALLNQHDQGADGPGLQRSLEQLISGRKAKLIADPSALTRVGSSGRIDGACHVEFESQTGDGDQVKFRVATHPQSNNLGVRLVTETVLAPDTPKLLGIVEPKDDSQLWFILVTLK